MAPPVVLFASLLQLLLAATFLILPAVAYRHGTAAQQAAEAQVAKQGVPGSILAQHRVRFAESAAEILFPVAIALCLATLASLNLAGSQAGRIGTWILQPILLIGGGVITASQVFVVRFIQSAFSKSDDTRLRDLNVNAFVEAAAAAFPAWLRPLQAARLVLVTAGSLLVVILLAVPSANAYFR